MTNSSQNVAVPERVARAGKISKWTSGDFPGRAVDLLNGINPYLFTLALLLLFFFRFAMHTDENHYMVLAKQFYSPDWVPNSFTFTEFAGTRVLYQYIAGFFLSFLSFEVASALGVLLMCLGMAWPMAKIYNLFQFSNVDILLHLPILYLARQSFIGAEVIFLAFEPKTFAYIFMFLAFYYMLTERYRPATWLTVASTYFHILVGGWFMVYFLIYHLIAEKSLKKTFVLGVLYTIGLVPFLIYLAPAITANFSESEAPVNLDWVYTYFLQPFHTALFKNPAFFQKGFLISLGLFSLCAFVFPKFRDERNRKLNLFNILLFSGTTLSLMLAYFDKTGGFVKYFPFRINAVFAFLIFLQIIFVFRQYFLNKDLAVYFQFGVLALFLTVPFVKGAKELVLDDIKPFLTNTLVEPAFQDMTTHIREKTGRDEVFLLLPEDADPEDNYSYDLSTEFVRRAERDQLVIFRAAPVSPGSDKLYQWYRRMNAKREIIGDHRQVCRINEQYRVDYLLTDFPVTDVPCCELSYRNEKYYLYRIRK